MFFGPRPVDAKLLKVEPEPKFFTWSRSRKKNSGAGAEEKWLGSATLIVHFTIFLLSWELQPASWLIKYKNILLGGVQQEVGAEAEDLVMVQTPLSSLRLNNDVLAHKVKDIEEKYNSLMEMSEKLR